MKFFVHHFNEKIVVKGDMVKPIALGRLARLTRDLTPHTVQICSRALSVCHGGGPRWEEGRFAAVPMNFLKSPKSYAPTCDAGPQGPLLSLILVRRGINQQVML